MIEDTGITEEFVCNSNSDCEDVKLEPYEIYDQYFNNMNNLSAHVFSTHRQKDSICEICGKSFKSPKALLNHKDVHKKVDCESCGKSFKPSAFYKHRKVCLTIFWFWLTSFAPFLFIYLHIFAILWTCEGNVSVWLISNLLICCFHF